MQNSQNSKNASHLLLDYFPVEIINTLDQEIVHQAIINIFSKVNLSVAQKMIQSSTEALHIIYILQTQGHISYYSQQQDACSFSIFLSDSQYSYKLENELNNFFSWENNSTNVHLPVDKNEKFTFFEEMPEKLLILHKCKYFLKERSQFQELTVLDTINRGRILLLDDFINIWDLEMEDDYSRDLSRHVGQSAPKDKIFESVLIIGGGDLLIADYLCKKFPNIKHITISELDNKVTEVVMEHFAKFQNWCIDENVENGKLQINFMNGADFVKKAKDNEYDGIIIDCSDTWFQESPAYVLTTTEFYSHLKRILKPGGGFSQQLSKPNLIPWFEERWRSAGFSKFETYDSLTPQYAINLPLGFVFKDEQ